MFVICINKLVLKIMKKKRNDCCQLKFEVNSLELGCKDLKQFKKSLESYLESFGSILKGPYGLR